MKCKRKHDPIRILEAIFYLLRSGCQWRLLPECYPHWKSVYNKWRYRNAKGIFNSIHRFLLKKARKKCGRNESPTICFIDSASRRSGLSDSVKGVDGFKKIKGIKRHLIVASQGYILHVHTTCANISDNKACLEMIAETKRKYPSLSADALLSSGLLRLYRLKSAIGKPACVKVTSVRRFLAYFARSHQSRCPHRSFFDSQNPLKNRRPYDPEILRNAL